MKTEPLLYLKSKIENPSKILSTFLDEIQNLTDHVSRVVSCDSREVLQLGVVLLVLVGRVHQLRQSHEVVRSPLLVPLVIGYRNIFLKSKIEPFASLTLNYEKRKFLKRFSFYPYSVYYFKCYKRL